MAIIMTVNDVFEKNKEIDRLYDQLCDLNDSKDFNSVDIDNVTYLLIEYKEELLSKKIVK